MLESERIHSVRNAARTYERALPAERRKRFGQHFTGLALSRLLAHLSVGQDTNTVLDPMAGHGDLLDAACEAAIECGASIRRLDGIEIDTATAAACAERLHELAATGIAPEHGVMSANAFSPDSIEALPERCYDLVIANPPYVRYQGRKGQLAWVKTVRSDLAAVVADRVPPEERQIWRALVDGYSGLADLSVPAWILAAVLVRPGGRLALVAPETWRSRNYAEVLRYLMLHCFRIECVVEDSQAAWFPDALVRTHLIVARRLTATDASCFADARNASKPVWARLSPKAANKRSLVGGACAGAGPEKQFAAWLRNGCEAAKSGIEVKPFDLDCERRNLHRCLARRRWYLKLGDSGTDLASLPIEPSTSPPLVPEALADLLSSKCSLLSLHEAGIVVGQGLRTGCNGFFHVTAQAATSHQETLVETSALFRAHRFSVPNSALRPVLRRQSELEFVENGRIPCGRVLDLRAFVLPEDRPAIDSAKSAYAFSHQLQPQVMPEELAAHVRFASKWSVDRNGRGKRIPELSAVCTNERRSRDGRIAPRFWYMLPDFAPRHLPAAFVPRINHHLPWTEANLNPPLLIDANFSSFWAPRGDWSSHAIKALMNSSWCRVAMEALGTKMGGGALKLEATHLRRLPVPFLSAAQRAELDRLGKRLARNSAAEKKRIDDVVLSAVCGGLSQSFSLAGLAAEIEKRALLLSMQRKNG